MNSQEKDRKDFEEAISKILANEGGYSSDDKDPGGETKFGISKRQHPYLNIFQLTLDHAKEIYYKEYWEPQPYENIEDIKIKIKMFDLAVNIGPEWSARLVQRALRSTGHEVEEDGDLGTVTVQAINRADVSDLLAALKSEAAGYYRLIVSKNPHLMRFLKGWLKRAYE